MAAVHRGDRAAGTVSAAWAVMIGVAALLSGGCGRPPARTSSATVPQPLESLADGGAAEPVAEPLSPAACERVERFCSACHVLPRPENFPRRQWPQEVRLGFDLYRASLRTDLPVPPESDAIRYFQAGAPEALVVPASSARPEAPSSVAFVPSPIPGIDEQRGPAVAQVLAVPPGAEEGGAVVLTTDMRSGEIRRWALSRDRAESRVLAASGHPCRLEAVPGRPGEWLLGDLGSYMPEDHDFGSVAHLIERSGEAEKRPIREGFSRVVGAIPFDFDREGEIDLLVVEFGWRRTGALRVLLGAGKGDAPAGQRVIDPRHGCLAARVADLDGDGRPDIVAAFAQEHETVDVWYGTDGGEPDHRQIVRLGDPSFGSSGLDLADVDGDGDVDIVHFNGDTMDSGLPRPTHGIRILVNDGGRSFRREEIAVMPGISQASVADIDGDGDADIVAGAFLPSVEGHPAGTFDSLLWVEQTPSGWRPHSIERDSCRHAAFALADVDGDGRQDIVAGSFAADAASPAVPLLRVWLNRPAATGSESITASDRDLRRFRVDW